MDPFPKKESNDIKKIEKQKIWDETAKKVEKITDGLGLGIDQKIKETVIALIVNDYSADASCEGHIEKEHGLPYPWVDIYAPAPEGWQKSDELKNQWRQENLKQREKMQKFLKEFYSQRKTDDAELILQNRGALGAFRIQSQGAESMENRPKQELQEKINLYQKEIHDFSDFLKEKYFSQ